MPAPSDPILRRLAHQIGGLDLERLGELAHSVEACAAADLAVPLAIAEAVLVGAGVLLGMQARSAITPDHVVVRVIDDGAVGGPQVLSTQVVPLR